MVYPFSLKTSPLYESDLSQSSLDFDEQQIAQLIIDLKNREFWIRHQSAWLLQYYAPHILDLEPSFIEEIGQPRQFLEHYLRKIYDFIEKRERKEGLWTEERQDFLRESLEKHLKILAEYSDKEAEKALLALLRVLVINDRSEKHSSVYRVMEQLRPLLINDSLLALFQRFEEEDQLEASIINLIHFPLEMEDIDVETIIDEVSIELKEESFSKERAREVPLFQFRLPEKKRELVFGEEVGLVAPSVPEAPPPPPPAPAPSAPPSLKLGFIPAAPKKKKKVKPPPAPPASSVERARPAPAPEEPAKEEALFSFEEPEDKFMEEERLAKPEISLVEEEIEGIAPEEEVTEEFPLSFEEADDEFREEERLKQPAILPSKEDMEGIAPPAGMVPPRAKKALVQPVVSEEEIEESAEALVPLVEEEEPALEKRIEEREKIPEKLGFWQKIKRKFIVAAEEKHVRVFELFLSDSAGKPGPLERLTAQSVLLMRGIQATIGLKFILFVASLDALLELFTKYIHNIYSGWKAFKTVQRRIKRALNNDQHLAIAEDLAISRFQLSRIFGFSGFYLDDARDYFPQKKEWQELLGPSFPLKQVLEIRGHIDQMARDLNIITVTEATEFVKQSFWGYLKSFIPNPFEVFTNWKDIFILIFFMKYRREEIEEMYAELIDSYEQSFHLIKERLEKELEAPVVPLENYHLPVTTYETFIRSRVLERRELPRFEEIDKGIPHQRRALKRLLYVLSYPEPLMDPQRWSRYDLIREMKNSYQVGAIHPLYELEFERWLEKLVRRELLQTGKLDEMEEKHLLKRELSSYLKRKKWFKKVSRKYDAF